MADSKTTLTTENKEMNLIALLPTVTIMAAKLE